MYDLPGTDSGREWVEVTNTGTDALDISGYKFFEANTNHSLTLLTGDPVLPAGGSAVLVEDQSKFMADWPQFSGVLLKASFDLSNTGETLAIKSSATADPDDSISYDSSMGAGGDGNSLHRNGSTFVAAAPDPGVFSSDNDANQSSGSDSSDDTTSSTSSDTDTTPPQGTSSGSNGSPTLSAHITIDQTAIAGAGTFISGSASTPSGEGLSNVRYIWNFGDGATTEGQTVFHTYAYPGTYVVFLTVASDLSAGTARAIIQAVPAQIGLLAQPDGSLVLLNQSQKEIDVGLWTLTSGTSTYMIPQNTIIVGSGNIRFSPDIMQMRASSATLAQYPNGAVAASAGSTQMPTAAASTAPISQTAENTSLPSRAVYAAPAAPLVPLPPTPTTSLPTQTAAINFSGFSSPLLDSVLGLCAVIVLGVAGVWYARAGGAPPSPPIEEETIPSVDEFDIS